MTFRQTARRLAINVAACLLLAAATLVGVEIYLRLTIPASSAETIYDYRLDTKRYKVMKPNARVVSWGKELRTNALGFRDNAPTVPAKAPGEFRIIVLGDSFTVSAGVDFARIYTSLVQAKLQETWPQARVINLAVGGYNVIQYRMVLEEVGLALEPDLIVVALFPENDFNNDTYETNYRVAAGRAAAVPQLPWHERLYVHRAYLGRLETLLAGWRHGKENPAAGPDTSAWDDNLAALQAIADRAKSRHLPLAVALLPGTWTFERQRGLFDRLRGHCQAHGLACLDLLEPFAATGVRESSLRLNVLDAHPNEAYNALAAANLAPYLLPYLAPHPAPPPPPSPANRRSASAEGKSPAAG